MMAGRAHRVAVKPATLWIDAADMLADREALENPDKDPRRTAAAINRFKVVLAVGPRGRSRVADLFPATGRQRAEKATPNQKLRRALYVELICRIDPKRTISKPNILKLIEDRFEYYTNNTWPHQMMLNHQPPNGANTHDDILWQFFKLGHKHPVKLQTIYNIMKKHLPRPTKRRRY